MLRTLYPLRQSRSPGPQRAIWLTLLFILSLPRTGAYAAEPAQSVFLVAKESVQDRNFRESVVLVTQHGRGGPIGLIINRPTRMLLSQAFPDVKALAKINEPLNFSGPIASMQVTYLFRAEEKVDKTIEVLPGTFMSFDPSILAGLLARPAPTKNLRLFAGYAAWAPGQLEMEVARGDWYMLPADEEDHFRDGSGGDVASID